MKADQTIRENIDRMESHEILRRLRSNSFSESAEIYARDVLESRGVDCQAEATEEEPTDDDSPGQFWPVFFAVTIGPIAGGGVGAAVGGAIGAGVGVAALGLVLIALIKRWATWLHGHVPSKNARIAIMTSSWLVAIWLAGGLGFVLKHAP